jgi:hypothetical protein
MRGHLQRSKTREPPATLCAITAMSCAAKNKVRPLTILRWLDFPSRARSRRRESKIVMRFDYVAKQCRAVTSFKNECFNLSHREGGGIKLEFLPPYAPELNPVAYLWAPWKPHEMPNFCPKDFAELSAFARAKRKRTPRRKLSSELSGSKPSCPSDIAVFVKDQYCISQRPRAQAIMLFLASLTRPSVASTLATMPFASRPAPA